MSAFERGCPQIDLNLSARTKDLRRGVTLAFRPPPAVLEKAGNFIERLARVASEQYCYRPEELHVTVLAVISGTESWRKGMRELPACRAVIQKVLSQCRPFKIHFQGVTASPGAVMIQGFPAGDALEKMRHQLRTAFAKNGLGDRLDRRYKITAAHMTILRFCRPGTDGKRLAAWLAENRNENFGEMEVSLLQLVWGDWYASANVVRTLQEFRLLEPVD